MSTMLLRLLGFLVALLLMVSPNSVFAQKETTSEPPQQSEPVAKPISTDSAETQTLKLQVKVLEAQLQTMKDFQSSVLDTVYWALGGVFVALGVLGGFGWMANFKIYERDKASLRAELLAEVSKTTSEQAKNFADLSTNLNKKLAADWEQIEAKLGAAMELVADRKSKPLQHSLQALDRQVYQNERMRLNSSMRNNPSTSMALTDALHLMEHCYKRSPTDVAEIIQFMLEKMNEGGQFSVYEFTQIGQLLDKLSPETKLLAERLRSKLATAEAM